MTANFITDEAKKTIITNINKQYVDDVDTALFCRSCCKNTADILDSLCHVIVGLSAVISFAAGSWDIKILTFVAGILNVISIVIAKLSSYSSSESKQYTAEINKITPQLGIVNIIDISDDPGNTTTRGVNIHDVHADNII